MKHVFIFLFLYSIFHSLDLLAQDKTHYTILNPTPQNLLRPLAPDRPGATDSSITLDPGFFRFESSLVSFKKTVSRSNQTEEGIEIKTREETLSFNEFFLSAGLLHNLEVQIGLVTYRKTHLRSRALNCGAQACESETSKAEGIGDMTLRLKRNLVGNDGGDYALAIIPSLYFPTGARAVRSEKLEGGVAIALSMALPLDLSLSIMPQWDVRKNNDNRNYHVEFLTGMVLDHQIKGELSGYIQFLSLASAQKDSTWQATTGGGLTYLLNPHLQLDLGIDLGITDNDEDNKIFTGIAWRF